MDDNTRSGLLSSLIPDEIEKGLGLGGDDDGKDDSLLVTTLKGLVGSSNSDLVESVSDFLGGKGSLLEITQAALTRGRKTAAGEVAAFLTTTFKIPEGTAGLIAPVLLRIFPGIKKLTGGSSAESKPRRKKKTTASSSSKPAAKKRKTTSGSKPKKETSSSARPKKRKTTGSKPAAKKPRRRSSEVPVEGEGGD
jgi:hypothetical protein